MTPVIAIRPEPGCTATVDAARAMGLNALGHPLFAVAPVAWEAPPPESFDALLLGSANALRHAGPGLAAYCGKPAYAVGETTAQAAREAGLDVVLTGCGGLQAVVGMLSPDHRRLLRLTGQARVPLIPPPDSTLAERVVYASEPLPMGEALAAPLRAGALVLLHSAEAARHFAAESARLGLDRARISLVLIGPRLIEAVGTGWRAMAIAATPDDQALLATARQLCQEADQSQTGQDRPNGE